jgi:hypothetical protein
MFRFPIKTLFRMTVFVASWALVIRETRYGSPVSKLTAYAILVGLFLWFGYKAGAKKEMMAEESELEKRGVNPTT